MEILKRPENKGFTGLKGNQNKLEDVYVFVSQPKGRRFESYSRYYNNNKDLD